MRKCKFNSQKGAISAFVMISMSFFLVVILGIYMITAKRAQTQTQSISIAQDQYYVEGEEEEAYDNRIASTSEVIPIYTKEQLWSVGENDALEIDGMVYTFASDASYELKNDIIINIDELKNSNFKDNFANITKNGFDIFYYYQEKYYTPVNYSGTVLSDITPVLSASGPDFSNISIITNGMSGEYYLFADANISKKLGYVTDGLLLNYDGIMNGQFKHDVSTSTWKDLSGNGNDGVLQNFDNNEASGWKENCLSFDGANDYVFLDNILNNTEDFTIEYIMPQKRYYSWEYFFGIQANRFGLESGSGQNRRLYINTGDTAWHVFFEWNSLMGNLNEVVSNTIVVDNTFLKGYKNASCLYNNTSNTYDVDTSGDSFNIGADGRASLPTLTDCYSFRIYNRALTDEEIQQNYKIDKDRFNIE